MRQRKNSVAPKSGVISTSVRQQSNSGKNGFSRSNGKAVESNPGSGLLEAAWILLGLGAAALVGLRFACYLRQLHENAMFFSSIKEVEREISFRTESGLYYSYYKQLLSQPSFVQGFYSLIHDNITEHPSTINVLARMNIYQEVLLATVYRSFSFLQRGIEPVYFYIDTVFALHGLLLCSLFAISWLLSGTWVAGLLTALFYIFNRSDVTRVEQWIPLRENFSLPFLWAQIAIVTFYFRQRHNVSSSVEKHCWPAILVLTFLFAVTWQFNQFALLLQAMALFALQTLELVPNHKIVAIYLCQGASMLVVCVVQFFNPMIITGVLLSFISAAIVVIKFQIRYPACHSGILARLFRVLECVAAVFVLTFIINSVAKFVVRHEADEHIYKFVMAKLGFAEPARDFHVRLYLCNGAFNYLDLETFWRLTSRLVFPIYVVSHGGLLLALVVCLLRRWRRNLCVVTTVDPTDDTYARRPELAYHVIQAVFFGAVGLLTLRMKFFWTPYMCILASVSLANREMWAWLLEKCRCYSANAVEIVRHVILVTTVLSLLYVAVPPSLEELESLREFYDPDTVALMNWIKTNTSAKSSFSGSMQLLAGVKLCTGRPIANHPHYEDKGLRQRTRELYQMYGRQTPQQVHNILTTYSVDYIILEDSHCLAQTQNSCRLPDLIDIDNGEIPDSGIAEPGLVPSRVPRFCQEVRHGNPEYSKLFRLVFENQTFRIYKVLRRKVKT